MMVAYNRHGSIRRSRCPNRSAHTPYTDAACLPSAICSGRSYVAVYVGRRHEPIVVRTFPRSFLILHALLYHRGRLPFPYPLQFFLRVLGPQQYCLLTIAQRKLLIDDRLTFLRGQLVRVVAFLQDYRPLFGCQIPGLDVPLPLLGPSREHVERVDESFLVSS